MNPYEEGKAVPNYRLPAMIIDKEAMCKQVRDDTQTLYILEQSKSCPMEIPETIACITAEGAFRLEANAYAAHVPDEQLFHHCR